MIEKLVIARIEQLIQTGTQLKNTDQNGQARSQNHCAECSGWLTSAQNAIYRVCEDPRLPHRQHVDRIAAQNHGWCIPDAVGEITEILKAILEDSKAGLLSSVADNARAETFDDFLDHAQSYILDKRKNESGVIAGVVFEDTVRRLCRRDGIEEKDRKLDALITDLTSSGVFNGIKAKRARAAAHVRTKASHAQWDEFEIEDVKATIEFTREIISANLAA